MCRWRCFTGGALRKRDESRSHPLFEPLREGAGGTGAVVLQAEVLINLQQALMMMEPGAEGGFERRIFTKEPQHGSADFLIIKEGGEIEILGP